MGPHDGDRRADAELRTRLLAVHERLCAAYGCPVPFHADFDPLTELIAALLSHRTRNEDTIRAFEELSIRFNADWEAVRDAPTAEVQAAIAACTWPEQKAPRIQQALRRIAERTGGGLSLDFLADMPTDAARAWLEELPGVGPKTSAAVLLFSTLRRPAMPVDSNHQRVAIRLGFITERAGPAEAHAMLAALLPPDWTAQQVYDHHETMMYHGQRCCYAVRPACSRCPVLALCPYGQARMAL